MQARGIEGTMAGSALAAPARPGLFAAGPPRPRRAYDAPLMPRSPPPRAIRPRVYLRGDVRIGPGKIDLLKHVAATRSISGAAREMDMSYKRAWQLVDSMNRDFGRPVVATATGGPGGGGAELTALGRALVERYTALEEQLNGAARTELAALESLLGRR
jgi:molybdate transport system regulatory protein